jgi:hypothetical protein
MKKTIPSLIAGVLLLVHGQANATQLNLTAGVPDLFAAQAMSVCYNPGSGIFQAIGYTVDYQGGSVFLQDVGTYSLTANITTGGVLTGGTVTINGDIGGGQEALLTGNLHTGLSGVAYGFENAGGDLFEFLFTVTGGNSIIISDFGGLGSSAGIILDANFGAPCDVPFTGTWTTGFHNSGSGNAVADNFPVVINVPEPSTSALLGLAAVTFFITQRRVIPSARRCEQVHSRILTTHNTLT